MAYGIRIPRFRLNSPYWQNFIVGILIGLTGGLYTALNLLGAGGGQPDSAHVVQVANATLCAVYAFSAFFGGSVLNKLGPALTGFFGVLGYILYVGSLWYFDQHGKQAFPIFAAVCIGISAGFIYVTQGYISMSYSEESERGMFVSMAINLQAVGAAIGGIIPLIINRNKAISAGVPTSVYLVFIIMDFVGAAMAFLLKPPEKVVREDGTNIAVIKPLSFMEEIKGNINAMKDWRLWVMIPAFLPSETFLVYNGSVNAYRNSLRARSLLSFCSVVLQIICGYGLQLILDNTKLRRKTRAFMGLAVIGIPLMAAWIWEIIRVRNYDRSQATETPLDWQDDGFGAIFVLFMINWVSSSLWQYVIMYFLGCFTNSPRVAANFAGVFRGFMAAGEAVDFGLDSIAIPFIDEAGGIFAFYATGLLGMIYLAAFHIGETKYFQEEEVTIPKHILEEKQDDLQQRSDEDGARGRSNTRVSGDEVQHETVEPEIKA